MQNPVCPALAPEDPYGRLPAKMKPASRLRWLFACAVPFAIYACAESDDEDNGSGPFHGLDSGKKDGSSSTRLDGSSTSDEDGATSSGDSGPKPVDGGSTTKDGSVSKDGGAPVGCAATRNCVTAKNIGEVKADNGNDKLTFEGTTSDWVSFRATESLTGIFNPISVPMKLNLKLENPPTADFDLYIYLNDTKDEDECTVVSAQSKATGNDEIGYTWGEMQGLANSSNDSRTVAVEIRLKSGTCSSGAKWKLTVEGNPP